MFLSKRMLSGLCAAFPYYFHVGSVRLNAHFVFEAIAYAAGFRLYMALRRKQGDLLGDVNRWSVIAAAAVGAVVGSKVLYWFEDPQQTLQHWNSVAFLLGGKTIVGALIGGLFAVEYAKRRLGILQRTGNLFAVPLCVGIAIGRIGCFLSGTEDHTAGIATTLPWGINFGDGMTRHPTQLYELLFALALGFVLWQWLERPHLEGDIFKAFMVCYFSFRLACDFLKPDVRLLLGMSSIQWACVAMLCYYAKDLVQWSGTNDGVRTVNVAGEGTSGVESTAPSGETAQ